MNPAAEVSLVEWIWCLRVHVSDVLYMFHCSLGCNVQVIRMGIHPIRIKLNYVASEVE